MFKKITRKYKSFQYFLKNKVSRPNQEPILIFGFPKSGTSAIASLLSKRTGLDATIDTKYLWEPYVSRISKGELNYERHISKFSYPFSKTIIKEPNLVFIVDEVMKYYDKPKVIIITRDKARTIKSILDRLKLEGNLSSNPKEKDINKNWRVLLLSENKHYVQNISEKYDLADNNLKKLEKYNPVYVKYEEFIENKIKTIDKIAKQLKLPLKNDISNIIDTPFQPRSRNDLSVEDFFGDNIKYI